MPSEPDNKITFRSFTLTNHYDKNFTRSGRNSAAKRDIERYRFLLGEAIASINLSLDEAIILWGAFNGVNTSHTEMLPMTKQGLISDLADNHSELAHKIKDWGLMQWFAVIDACDRLGGGAYHIEDLAIELKKVGLIKGDL